MGLLPFLKGKSLKLPAAIRNMFLEFVSWQIFFHRKSGGKEQEGTGVKGGREGVSRSEEGEVTWT